MIKKSKGGMMMSRTKPKAMRKGGVAMKNTKYGSIMKKSKGGMIMKIDARGSLK